jgi:hypothetical protein
MMISGNDDWMARIKKYDVENDGFHIITEFGKCGEKICEREREEARYLFIYFLMGR